MSIMWLLDRTRFGRDICSAMLTLSMSLVACGHPGTQLGPAGETLPRSRVESPSATELALPRAKLAVPRMAPTAKLALSEVSRSDTAVDSSPNMLELSSAPTRPNNEHTEPDVTSPYPYSRAALEALDRISVLVPVLEDERGKFFRLSSDDMFEAGSAQLSATSTYVLDRLIPTLKRQTGVQIVVQAFTDSLGSAAEAREVSLRRARAVARHLRRHGVPASQLTAQGFGPDRPIADNSTPDGRRQNRRIEIVLGPQQRHGRLAVDFLGSASAWRQAPTG